MIRERDSYIIEQRERDSYFKEQANQLKVTRQRKHV